MSDGFKTIIGLEIHVQLQTESKLFCGCSTEFGSAPNTHTCFVCTGMPGALPVLNEKALELSIKTGLALNCKIQRNTKWDRKNYFYPDLPKGYQISQFDRPICYEGFVDLVDDQGTRTGQRIRIERAHLEEDAGKSNHDESGQGGDSKIDLNRAGTPLLEIVTMPDLSNSNDAKNFLSELKLILTYIGVSDCNMQQGNLRVDANVNVEIESAKEIFTPIVEVKNLNSFRAVERAINYEVQRQIKDYKESGVTKANAPKQTRGWNDDKQRTYVQREKEDAADYRYFPDPDLVSIRTSADTIERLEQEIGDLPNAAREKLLELGLSVYDADVLVRQGSGVIHFFDQSFKIVGNAKLISNWTQQEVLRHLNETNSTIDQYPLSPETFSELLIAISKKQIDQNRGKDVLAAMVENNIDFRAAKEKLGIVEVDQSEIEDMCRAIVDENPAAVNDILSGNAKAVGALIGQARKRNPNANPGDVRQCLLAIIEAK